MESMGGDGREGVDDEGLCLSIEEGNNCQGCGNGSIGGEISDLFLELYVERRYGMLQLR